MPEFPETSQNVRRGKSAMPPPPSLNKKKCKFHGTVGRDDCYGLTGSSIRYSTGHKSLKLIGYFKLGVKNSHFTCQNVGNYLHTT